MTYDVAIIGTGPAGISAALNLKLHNKNIIWFGSKDLSVKVQKSEKIANYPGVPMVSGEELNSIFKRQINEAGLIITEAMVNNIAVTRRGFMIQADNDIYEAKKILLAVGTMAAKSVPGEDELLGKGVSYCATCDGFLYKDKVIAVFCADKRFEHEVRYLAELAEKVYLYTVYKDSEIDLPNVEIIEKITDIRGENHVEGFTAGNTDYSAEAVFFLRNAVAPSKLLKKLELDGNHIKVNRDMETNISGCYAAGDCTGRPYQLTKAVGEGNIAAHAMLE